MASAELVAFLFLFFNLYWSIITLWVSLVAQLVRNLPAVQETWVQSLGWEDPLERGRLPIPVFWPGEFNGMYRPWGCKATAQDATERLSLSLSPLILCIK